MKKSRSINKISKDHMIRERENETNAEPKAGSYLLPFL